MIPNDLPAELHGPMFMDSPASIAVWNKDYSLSATNKRWANLFHYSDMESAGKDVASMIHIDDREVVIGAMLLITEQNYTYQRLNRIRIRAKDGSEKWVTMTLFGIRSRETDKFLYGIIWAICSSLVSEKELENTSPKWWRDYWWITILVFSVFVTFSFEDFARMLIEKAGI